MRERKRAPYHIAYLSATFKAFFYIYTTLQSLHVGWPKQHLHLKRHYIRSLYFRAVYGSVQKFLKFSDCLQILLLRKSLCILCLATDSWRASFHLSFPFATSLTSSVFHVERQSENCNNCWMKVSFSRFAKSHFLLHFADRPQHSIMCSYIHKC